jgi:hypothetical protein
MLPVSVKIGQGALNILPLIREDFIARWYK